MMKRRYRFMNYCENCYHLTNQERCPYCYSTALREVHDDDYCFLITQSAIWCEAIKETLEQHHITYECIQEMGSGLSLKVGPYLENYHFYVPYHQYAQAQELMKRFEDSQ